MKLDAFLYNTVVFTFSEYYLISLLDEFIYFFCYSFE